MVTAHEFVYSFGGWTEMMRDGIDKDGLWDLLNRGLE